MICESQLDLIKENASHWKVYRAELPRVSLQALRAQNGTPKMQQEPTL